MIDAAGLRVIRAIAENGSFTAAAHSLGYTQPAISQMVRRLEKRTGTPLVERNGRSVRLTEAGRVLARHAVKVLAALEAAEAEITAIAGLRAGRVRLVAFPSSSALLVPRALAMVRSHHPEVSVTFSEAEPPQSLEALRGGDCDLAITFTWEGNEPAADDEYEGFVKVPLLTDSVRLVLPKAHPLADQDQVDLADLADENWIAGCSRCRGHLMSLCSQAGFTPTVSFETEDYVAVLGLVAEGLGVALVPDLILKSAHNPSVVALPLSPASHRTISAVTTPDLQRVPTVQATLRSLKAVASSLADGTSRVALPAAR